jgi:hypothetical protein
MATELIHRTTATHMAAEFQAACADIRKAYELLEGAKNRLSEAFEGRYGFNVIPENRCYRKLTEECEGLINKLRAAAWGAIAEKVSMRQLMPTDKIKEFDRMISTAQDKDGKPLPDVQEENIVAMLADLAGNLEEYFEGACKEVFRFLRPRGLPATNLVTNSQFRLGRKVILPNVVRISYGGGFDVNTYYQDDVRQLDNVFSLLDGQGPVKTYRGSLGDAIFESGRPGKGETKYFAFQCCKNGNLHLTFKRMDLVEKLNLKCGGEKVLRNPQRKNG